MARPPSSDRYELSDTERSELIKLIQAGKPLPERHRFLLFDDKREVELVWNGKTRDVCTAVLPFQTPQHIDKPRKESGPGILACASDPTGENAGAAFQPELLGVATADGQFTDFENHWTKNHIFENEWQSFRTRQNRDLELKTAPHTYTKPVRYTVAIKVIDIFGNDTMTLLPVSVG